MNIRTQIYGQSGPAESPLVCVKAPRGALPNALLSIPVEREHNRRSDTRVEERYLLHSEQAHVVRDGATHDVDLLNLCGGGAMIAARFEPMLWERLDLHLGGRGPIACTVLWIKHGRIGLEFAHDSDERALLVSEAVRRHFPDARFDAPSHEEPEATGDLRHDPRHPFLWSGTLHCEYGSTPARLRNISRSGAMIETAFELSPGTEPYLDLGEAGSLFGTISWSAGETSGFKFHEPFALERLARARPDIAEADALIRFGSTRH